jgi:virulence factor Mce-like protein
VKRIAAVASVLACAALAVLLSAAGGKQGGSYRVDAIFDNAAFLIPGQDVKIAGAKVGSVVGVKLTPDLKARIEMAIDGHFAPFRSDADCTIQPQSLIGEKFIQCTPGTPRGRPLAAAAGHPPTVPVARTHAPVDFDLVLNTFREPAAARLALIVDTLGAGLAGNGAALNAALLRANPALAETRRVLAILDRDRAVLGDVIDESDRIIGELARRSGQVRTFIDRASRVAATTAERRGALAESIRRLPAALAQAEPSLRALREMTDATLPVLGHLDEAARPLARLTADVPPLAKAARPALDHLGAAARTGTATLREAAPTVAKLREFAAAALPTGQLVAELVDSLQKRGAVEGLQTFVHLAALTTSRFDAISHILPAHVLGDECGVYADKPAAACDAHFASGGAAPHSRTSGSRARHRMAGERGARGGPSAGDAAPPSTGAPSSGREPREPSAPSAPERRETPVQRILDFLLR